MKIDDIKAPVALFAASWIIRRSVTWGFHYMIQENPDPNSLIARAKQVYINVITSNNGGIWLLREFFGSIYDWTPATIAIMSYMGGTVQICRAEPFYCFVKLPFVIINACSHCWFYVVYFPINYLSSHGPKEVSQVAGKIKPWVTPTGITYQQGRHLSLMHQMYLHFFNRDGTCFL
jgi:hypothetical protein